MLGVLMPVVRVVQITRFMLVGVFIFFFKQKPAYEMRISDWSSDVCSSDLGYGRRDHAEVAAKLLLPPSGHKASGRFEEVLLLLWDGRVNSAADLAPIAETAKGRGLSLCVVAQKFGDEAMQFIETNATRGAVDCFPIRAPGQDSDGDRTSTRLNSSH